MRHGREKSDSAIVAGKPTNKAVPTAAEPVEPRSGTKGNASQQSTHRTQGREGVSQALERVRQAARQRTKEKFTALLHHISVDCLRMAFSALKRDAASGVDGLTWPTYEADLDRNLTDLHARVQRGAYRALPSRRGRTATPTRGRGAGGQDCPTGDGRGAERDLRGRLPRIQLWVPARPRGARRTRCARGRAQEPEGELHLGCRHSVVLRHREPGMARTVPGTPDRRPAHHPPDPEMAQGGRAGRWGRERQ